MVLRQTTSNSNSQDSPRPRLGGSRHLPPYSILYSSTREPHPNGFLTQDSRVGVPKFPQLGLPRLWGPITSCANLQLQWGLKQSYRFCQKLFNDMSHAAYTHVACMPRNWVDSWLLMVGSQTALLIITCVSNVQMADASPF